MDYFTPELEWQPTKCDADRLIATYDRKRGVVSFVNPEWDIALILPNALKPIHSIHYVTYNAAGRPYDYDMLRVLDEWAVIGCIANAPDGPMPPVHSTLCVHRCGRDAICWGTPVFAVPYPCMTQMCEVHRTIFSNQLGVLFDQRPLTDSKICGKWS